MAWLHTVSELLVQATQGRALLRFWVCTVPGSQKFLLVPRSLTAIAESITERYVFLSSYFRGILWSRAFKKSAQLSKSLDKSVLLVAFPVLSYCIKGKRSPCGNRPEPCRTSSWQLTSPTADYVAQSVLPRELWGMKRTWHTHAAQPCSFFLALNEDSAPVHKQ